MTYAEFNKPKILCDITCSHYIHDHPFTEEHIK